MPATETAPRASRTALPRAADARALLTVAGCTSGFGVAALVLAERGILPTWVLPAATGATVLVALRTALTGSRDGWPGLVVFALALAWFGPGYDAMLYGSDATVYYAYGAHIASAGQLWVDDPVLARLPHAVEATLFPSHGLVWDAARSRSAAGLGFFPLDSRVYSVFSQLPSVLLAFGWSVGGPRGAVWVTPFLAAGATAAFFAVARRHLGLGRALLSATLLAVCLPQMFFARLPMAEAAGQFFVWNGLLALDATYRDGTPRASWIAGLCFAASALCRPELIVLLPLAAGVAWAARPSWRLPTGAWVPALAGIAYASLLIFHVVPTHYREPARNALLQAQLQLRGTFLASFEAWLWVAAALLAVLVPFLRRAARRRELPVVGRVAATGAALVWLAAFASRGGFHLAGDGLAWMSAATAVVTAILAALGLPALLHGVGRSTAGLFLLALAGLSALHFLPAAHTAAGSPLWASRRLVPLVLPALALAIACACRTRRLPAMARGALSVLALALVASTGRPLWGATLLTDTTAGAARVAELTHPEDLVLVDPSLRSPLLDVPLLVVHGRATIGLRGMAGASARTDSLRDVVERPVTALLPAILRPAPGAEITGRTDLEFDTPNGAVRLAVQAIRPVSRNVNGPGG